MTKQEVLEQLKRVADQYHAAKYAVRRLLAEAMKDPGNLEALVRPNDLKGCLDRLEATYFVMLFAEFESAIRNVWKAQFRKKTRPRMEILLDSIAAKAYLTDADLRHVHSVRRYRNFLVHGEDFAETVTLEKARSLLARFFYFMPGPW